MTFLVRVWLAITSVLAIVILVLAALVELQDEAVYSHLLRQRLSVIASATAGPFRSVVDLGLPVATVRNAQELLMRAWQTDPDITSIVLLDASGQPVLSVPDGKAALDARQVANAMEGASDGEWSFETANALFSGVTIVDDSGEPAGALAVIYPMNELRAHSSQSNSLIRWAALAILAAFSAFTYIMLHFRLRPAIRTLDEIASHSEDDAPDDARDGDLPEVRAALAASTVKYRAARAVLAGAIGDREIPVPEGREAAEVISVPDSPIAISVSRRLTLLIAALVLGTTLCLGYVAYRSVEHSFAPELDKRTKLIGGIVDEAITRTLKAGVPLDSMVGGRDFFTSLLRNFPEISYFALVTNRPILEVGERPPTSTAQMLRASTVVPVVVDDKLVANVVVVKNAGYLSRQFRDVVLDLVVVTLVTILLAVELVSVMTNHSLTGPLTRLDYILKLQAAGDFSRRILTGGASAVDRLGQALSERAERLAAMMLVARGLPEGRGTAALEPGLVVPAGRPTLMRFSNLSDVRLPLFLFAAADSFPLSFFSLYVRDAENPLTWLNPGIVISLPLAAYLLAVVFGSSSARSLSKRIGHRNLFLLSTIPGVLANVGFFFSTNIPEIVFFCVLSGIGYAFASLSCQDYVIDAAPKEQRAQALGLFHVAIFGGIYAGTALGGVIADRLGERSVFLLCTVLVVVAGTMIYYMLPRPVHATTLPQPGAGLSPRRLLATMGDARFATLLFGIVLPQTILDQVFISYLLSLQMNALSFSSADTGRMMMIYFLMIILSGSLYGRLPPGRIPPVGIATVGALTGGLTLLTAAVATNGWTMLVAAIGTGLGYGMVQGPQTAMVMDMVEGELAHIGAEGVLGTVRVMERLSSVAGLFIVAGVAGTFGYSAGMATIAILVLTGAGAFFTYRMASMRLLISRGRNV